MREGDTPAIDRRSVACSVGFSDGQFTVGNCKLANETTPRKALSNLEILWKHFIKGIADAMFMSREAPLEKEYNLAHQMKA